MKQMLLVLLLLSSVMFNVTLLISCSKSPSKYRVKMLSTNIIETTHLDDGFKSGDTVLVKDYNHRDSASKPTLARALVLDRVK